MPISNLLALDVGDVRVGIAIARADVLVPVALGTLTRSDETFWPQLNETVIEYEIATIVIGLPRDINGNDTAQTALAKSFAQELLDHQIIIPVAWQDEAVTSIKAEAILKQSKKGYAKSDIDALAACYILEDYINSVKVTT